MRLIPSIVYEKPYLTIALLVLVTAVMAGGIPRLEKRNSFDGEIPANDPINIDIEKVEARFDESSLVLIGLETNSVYNKSTLEKVVRLSEDIAELPFAIEDEIYSLATVQNLSDREWGLESGGFLDRIPFTNDEWSQLKRDVASNENVIGKLVSENGRLAVVAVALEEGFEGGAVYEAALQLASKYEGPEKLHVTGAPIIVEDVQMGIGADSKTFMPIALLLIFFGFFLCFRRLSGVLLPVIMVVISIVWTMGLMGYLGLPVTVVSNALPIIMVAVASSYGIHFMNF